MLAGKHEENYENASSHKRII